MKPELSGFVAAHRRRIVVVPALALVALAGCSQPLFKKTETIEEGPMAARREAEAAVLAQAAAGDTGLRGTSSSIPSLVPGEGRVVLPAADAPPPTAPPEDEFDNDDAGHLLARCRDRSARHQWFDAIGDCRRSWELNPASIEPQVELMRLLVTLQSYGDAEEAAKKVLAARPNDAVALYYLAWSYRGRDQFPKAIATLQRAVAIDPKRVEFVQALGMTYCLAENYGKGIATLEQALAMRPGDGRIQQMIAEARARLREKLAPYQKLVRDHPESYDNHAALGFMYQKYGLSQPALTAYDSALAMIPTPIAGQDAETRKIAAQIYYNRGVVYRDLGRPERGEPALWQAMQLDPSLGAAAWYFIGLCRYDAGKFEPSIDALRKSIDLEPDVADNRAALAEAYDKAGKPKDAREQRNAVMAIEARMAGEKEAIAREEAGGDREVEHAPAAPAAPAPSSTDSPATPATDVPAADSLSTEAPATDAPPADAPPAPAAAPQAAAVPLAPEEPAEAAEQ